MKPKKHKKKFYRSRFSLADHIKMRLDWKDFSFKLFNRSWEQIFKEDGFL